MLGSVTSACGRDAKPPVNADQSGFRASPPAPVTDPNAAIPKSKGNVAIDENIRAACGIGDADAYFEFDSAAIDQRARRVLAKVAECFETGALRGRRLRLIGHADPRGDSEYNMVLGGERASSVQRVLTNEGLSEGRISTSSRGEMDATGTNESTWAQDRRVDVTLGG
jgi:peptidoglycan-associated lipoprotein